MGSVSSTFSASVREASYRPPIGLAAATTAHLRLVGQRLISDFVRRCSERWVSTNGTVENNTNPIHRQPRTQRPNHANQEQKQSSTATEKKHERPSKLAKTGYDIDEVLYWPSAISDMVHSAQPSKFRRRFQRGNTVEAVEALDISLDSRNTPETSTGHSDFGRAPSIVSHACDASITTLKRLLLRNLVNRT